MSKDLIERLREGRTTGTDLRWTVTPEHLEAAAEIERLRAKLAEVNRDNAALINDLVQMGLARDEYFARAEAAEKRLAEALQKIATGGISGEPNNYRDTVSVMRGIAREALGGRNGRQGNS